MIRGMARTRDLSIRLPDLLQRHQRLTSPAHDPRNRLRWLPELRRWQAARLRRSFAHFLEDPRHRAAAEFFLSDVYGDHDFSRRDADIARVVPLMQKLLPDALLASVADAIELGLLTHAFDLRMAQVLDTLAHQHFVPFVSLFKAEEGRLGVVVTFLAVMELIKESLVEIVQSESFAPIHVKARTQ